MGICCESWNKRGTKREIAVTIDEKVVATSMAILWPHFYSFKINGLDFIFSK